jgi:hypothetical protein
MDAQLMQSKMYKGFRRVWISITTAWLIYYVVLYVTNCHELPRLPNGPFSFDYATWEKIHHYTYVCYWNYKRQLISVVEIIARAFSIPIFALIGLLVLLSHKIRHRVFV